MSQTHILYEQPLSEHFRAYLRLEHLFNQVRQTLDYFDISWAARSAVSAVLDIINVLDRPDLKTKLFKELNRQINYFVQLRQKPGVDEQRVNEILEELEDLSAQLQSSTGRLGQKLRENDILNCARQHLYNPGGACQFDAPLYHFWLTRPTADRVATVERWLEEFQLIEGAIRLLLNLTRQCAHLETCFAKAGFYQLVLPVDPPCKLVRVYLPASSAIYPEVSVGKHQVYIRLFVRNDEGQWRKSDEDLELQVACCAI